MSLLHPPLYSHIVIGGTFDRLHNGHFLLLSTSFHIGKFVSIGLTSSIYLERYPKKHKDQVYSYSNRLQQLTTYLLDKKFMNFHIIPIDHPWKNFSITEAKFEAIVASEETLPTVIKINQEREQSNPPMNPLTPVIIPGALSFSGDYLSSTKLRQQASTIKKANQ